MKRIAVLVAAAAAAVVLVVPATSSAATSSPSGSCTVYVQTPAGPFSGWITRSSRTSCPFARNVARVSLRAISGASTARSRCGRIAP